MRFVDEANQEWEWSHRIDLDSGISSSYTVFSESGEKRHFRIYMRLEGSIIYAVFSYLRHSKSDFQIINQTEDIDISYYQDGSKDPENET